MGLVVAENITKIYSVVATKVSKDYKVGEIAIRALNEVSFEIDPASFVSFIGPSGSGKTTLLNMIGGLDRPTEGGITVNGQTITELDENALAVYRRQQVGFVFQSFNLIATMNALDNVKF